MERSELQSVISWVHCLWPRKSFGFHADSSSPQYSNCKSKKHWANHRATYNNSRRKRKKLCTRWTCVGIMTSVGTRYSIVPMIYSYIINGSEERKKKFLSTLMYNIIRVYQRRKFALRSLIWRGYNDIHYYTTLIYYPCRNRLILASAADHSAAHFPVVIPKQQLYTVNFSNWSDATSNVRFSEIKTIPFVIPYVNTHVRRNNCTQVTLQVYLGYKSCDDIMIIIIY